MDLTIGILTRRLEESERDKKYHLKELIDAKSRVKKEEDKIDEVNKQISEFERAIQILKGE